MSPYSPVSTLVGMQSYLEAEGYDQIPQLSVGHPNFDLRDTFSVLNPKCKGDPEKLSGNTRAVLIGINYPGSSCPLDGACNDVTSMRRYITKRGFSDAKRDMRVLRDVGDPDDIKPTKKNIEAALKWLVQGAEAGDSLFLHFSGHGGSMVDKTVGICFFGSFSTALVRSRARA